MPLCPVRVWRTLPVSVLQTLMVKSLEDVAMRLPSGENETDQTGPACPLRVCFTLPRRGS